MRLTRAVTAALALAGVTAASAQPAVIYELGGKFDRSFNQAASDGAERWKKETGKPFLEFEIAQSAQREQAARRFAERGANPVVAIGFPQAEAIGKVAREFPKTSFAIIDAVVDAPNVHSVVYREHEGAFLVGVLAAMSSKSGKIGFVGGMDIPHVRKFLCGYEQGARHANPKVQVLSAMAGSTPAAWTDPVRGAELTRGQIAQGVDVVFAAAGTTGLGILQAAKDGGIYGIGVDSNQNHLHPGTMLTSLVKRTDLAVYQAFQGVKPGVSPAGPPQGTDAPLGGAGAQRRGGLIQSLGLKEGGLDYAVDQHNDKLLTPAMRQKAEAARADIIAGRLKVIDYTVANRCQ